jgi:membrane protein DedA with SNARE-associated domain
MKVLLGYRLMFGFRGAIVFGLGLGRVRGETFTILNLAVSLIWAVAMSAVGTKLARLLNL